MKYLTLLLFISLIFSSCKRDWTCTCKKDGKVVFAKYVGTAERWRNSKAEGKCIDYANDFLRKGDTLSCSIIPD